MSVGNVAAMPRTPRDITTEGLEFEECMITFELLDTSCNRTTIMDRLFKRLRRDFVRNELERRELAKRRAM